jgi:hypothetical protein
MQNATLCVLSYWQRRRINHGITSIKVGADITNNYAETVVHCWMFIVFTLGAQLILDLPFIRSSLSWVFTQYTGLLKIIVGVLTICHTQYT